jgi:hypothetical protein
MGLKEYEELSRSVFDSGEMWTACMQREAFSFKVVIPSQSRQKVWEKASIAFHFKKGERWMINTRNYFCLGTTRVYSKMIEERRADLCTFKNQVAFNLHSLNRPYRLGLSLLGCYVILTHKQFRKSIMRPFLRSRSARRLAAPRNLSV